MRQVLVPSQNTMPAKGIVYVYRQFFPGVWRLAELRKVRSNSNQRCFRPYRFRDLQHARCFAKFDRDSDPESDRRQRSSLSW